MLLLYCTLTIIYMWIFHIIVMRVIFNFFIYIFYYSSLCRYLVVTGHFVILNPCTLTHTYTFFFSHRPGGCVDCPDCLTFHPVPFCAAGPQDRHPWWVPLVSEHAIYFNFLSICPPLWSLHFWIHVIHFIF